MISTYLSQYNITHLITVCLSLPILCLMTRSARRRIYRRLYT